MARLERLGVRATPASQLAASLGCPYCIARNGSFAETDSVAVLSGLAAGSTYRVVVDDDTRELLGEPIFPPPRRHVERRRYLRSSAELIGKLPLMPPNWLPNLSLRDTFIVDELIVWFTEGGVSPQSYVWCDRDFDEIITVIWEKRLPITADELVGFLAAHGVPSIFHSRAKDRFETGLQLLCRAKGRPPLKKRRLDSFDDRDADPRKWFDRFVLPGLSRSSNLAGDER